MWKLKNAIDNLKYEEKSDVSIGRRIGAFLIDWYIGGVFSCIPIGIMYQLCVKNELVLSTSLFILPPEVRLLTGILVLILAFVYYIVVPTYIWKGQTLGKKILKIKIVKDDYSELNLKTVLVRQMWMFLIEGRFIMPSTILHEMISVLLNYNIVFICSSICYMVTLCSVIFAFKLKSGKALHDIFAHTKVMQVNSKLMKKKRKIKK